MKPAASLKRKSLKRVSIARSSNSLKRKTQKTVKEKKAPAKKTKTRLEDGRFVWGLARADTEVSRFIRERDGKCMFPGCDVREFTKLQCSHYFGRARNSTRFHPDNLIALCRKHHYGDKLIGWEFAKQRHEYHGRDGEYTTFMKNLLGHQRFKALEELNTESVKQKVAVTALMKYLENKVS